MSPLLLAKCSGRVLFRTSFLVALASLRISATAGEPTVPLGRATDFAVFAGYIINNGATVVMGDAGVPVGGVVQGFPPGTISGLVHTGNVAAADAQTDLAIAFDDAAARTPDVVFATPEVGGLTLTAGVYRASARLEITSGDLTLDARGDPNAVFIFQVPGGFVQASGRRVVLAGSARAGRVFWQISGGVVDIATGSRVKGNFLTDALMTVHNGAELEGRALSFDNAVNLDTAIVRPPAGGSGAPAAGRVFVESFSDIVLNPQTGLLEQTITVRNVGSNAVEAARVWVKNLRPNVTVYNATGKTVNGHPFVQYNLPLAAGSSVDMVIEYLRPSRLPFPSPSFFTNTPARSSFAAPAGQMQAILRRLVIPPDRMLVEFATIPGRQYAVQYSDDSRIWKTARPTLTANANRVFWLDYGAPKTEGIPASSRRYRVVKLF